MFDLLFLLTTLAFFALMLAYVRGCARLGARGGESGEGAQ
jgi:hypothetical protein